MKHKIIMNIVISSFLVIISGYACCCSIYCNNDIYKNFDVTGASQYVQIGLTVTLFLVSLVCLVNSIRALKSGIDFKFNAIINFVFIIFIILSIASFIFIRAAEENAADDREFLVTSPKTTIKEIEKRFEDLQESDENHVIRKYEISRQKEHSSVFERYISMLVYNSGYKYYGRSGKASEEVTYYSMFLNLAIVGVVGAVYYGVFLKNKEEQYNNKNIGTTTNTTSLGK